MKALIFHGTHGSPQGNWFQWLQEHLMIEGWQVATPKLPTPENQSYDNWKLALEKQIPGYADVDVVVGHSCGGSFALRLLEESLIEPEQVILVSTVSGKLDNEFDELNHSFIDKPFNWDVIKQACDNFTLLHGDNDPYVPLNQAKSLADNLQTNLIVIENGGHLNSENGYDQFPEILEFLDV